MAKKASEQVTLRDWLHMSAPLFTILTKMCDLVGVDISRVNFRKPGWFNEHRWTWSTQRRFQRWLESYLYRNAEARQLFGIPRNKRAVKSAASMFVFNYGWATIDSPPRDSKTNAKRKTNRYGRTNGK